MVLDVVISQEEQVLEDVEVDLPLGKGDVGLGVIVEVDDLDVDALGGGLLLEDLPVVVGGLGGADLDSSPLFLFTAKMMPAMIASTTMLMPTMRPVWWPPGFSGRASGVDAEGVDALMSWSPGYVLGGFG